MSASAAPQGDALLARGEVEAAAAGVGVLRLEVIAGNRGARQFYQRNGWQERVVQLHEAPCEGFRKDSP